MPRATITSAPPTKPSFVREGHQRLAVIRRSSRMKVTASSSKLSPATRFANGSENLPIKVTVRGRAEKAGHRSEDVLELPADAVETGDPRVEAGGREEGNAGQRLRACPAS